MSPGTSAAVSRRISLPSRSTLASGADICRRASRAFSALSSCEMEMQALTATMTRMMAASSQSSPPVAHRDSPAAASSTKIMGSFICPKKRRSSPARRWRASSLGPQRSSLRPASAGDRPRSRSVSNSPSTCLTLLAYQAFICISPDIQNFPVLGCQYSTRPVRIQGKRGGTGNGFCSCAARSARRRRKQSLLGRFSGLPPIRAQYSGGAALWMRRTISRMFFSTQA